MPLDARSSLLLRYRGEKRTFRYVSAADVMRGRMPAEAIRDKIVFVGTNALGTREVVATPLDTLFAGVEVQATVADNLLQQDFISRSAATRVGEVGGGAGRSAPAWRSCSRSTGIVAGLLGGAVGAAALWVACVSLLSSDRRLHLAAVRHRRHRGRAVGDDARRTSGSSASGPIAPAASARRRASCSSKACCR